MKDLIHSIFNIFRWVGKFLTGFRILTLNLAFLVLLFFIFTSLSSYSPQKEVKISTNGALVLSLSGDIVEEKQAIDPVSSVLNDKLGLNTGPTETLFQDILDSIAEATIDDKVTFILLDLSELGTVGLNQLQIIGKALTEFKGSGKKIIAAEDFYQQKAYYLASFADEIYLNPMGAVDLHGLGAYRLYFKDALNRLKINYHIFRVGTFKSAMEPIMRNSMSDEARSQNLTWLTALWDTVVTDITRERKLSKESLRTYTENIASELASVNGDTAQLALETKLVDGLKTREELRSYLIELTGKDSTGNFKQIALNDYLKTIPHSFIDPPAAEGSIGIIIAQGTILNGEQPIGVIGGDSLGEMIREAREDSNINALVLRINSGGGSVFASEVIRQEILEYKKSGKPLVVSMGSMAASGGYWIAADADKIWASPVTLTGSIGIFAAIPTFEKSLSELGIYNDGVGTTSLAAALDLTQPLSPPLKESIQISLHHGYDQFLGIVAKGRSMSREEVALAAEGRVFDGATAQRLGLVDELGTMEDAIDSAAALAGLEDYSASYIRKPLTVKDEILQLFSGTISGWLSSAGVPQSLLTAFSRLLTPIRQILFFNDPKGLYAHCLLNDLSL
ncbi:MAG: signal peptide peptidase SppA [Proteobacteria bacterium]|nr:signal peptide peptidase SppA [Pseudomonadota bacterium]MBU1231496.1 signal peptide peptidase SppA [Pseudomonadota bacterium]MBU1420022.1 signal peptide peptidase SppA [Pseudomonadota bacterium]MBU1453081.1 signal peptide peptidase SppA [Pseudomonadota bacterium]